MPFRLPVLSEEELLHFASGSFHEAVAQALNLLFGVKVTAWEVSCCIGRYPVRISDLSRKTLVAELWHNQAGDVDWLVSSLTDLLCEEPSALDEGNWADVGIRIAVLCGIVSLLREGDRITGDSWFDISLTSGDFAGVMAAWYAKRLGLPIGKIIVCCKENSALWDLIHQGQMRTDRLTHEKTDILIPVGLERLIYECGGNGEVERYLDRTRRGGIYCPAEVCLDRMRRDLTVSVVGQARVTDTVSSVISSRRYAFSDSGALSYAGLLDHRVISGESHTSVVLAEKRPSFDADAKVPDITTEEQKRYI